MAPDNTRIIPKLPTTAPLPSSHRLASTDPTVIKTLSSLSRNALLDLASQWCLPKHSVNCRPYINEDSQENSLNDLNDGSNPWTASTSLEELHQLYAEELSTRRGTKRELLDRILEGDWRHGVSLEQIAMADIRGALENSSAGRWAALEIYEKKANSVSPNSITAAPKLNPKSFIRALHLQLGALTKAHYFYSVPKTHPLTIVRIALFDSPYSNVSSSTSTTILSAPKSILLAFPHQAPSYVYVSRQGLGESDLATANPSNPSSSAPSDMISFTVKSIGAALSRPGIRFTTRTTHVVARSLDTLLLLRGAEANGSASGVSGGWSVFADGKMNGGTERDGALDITKSGGLPRVIEITKAKKNKRRTGQENEEDGDRNVDENRLGNIPVVLNPNVPFQHGDPMASIPGAKRTKLSYEAAARFGAANIPATSDGNNSNHTALPRFHVEIRDALLGVSGASVEERSSQGGHVRLSFTGRDVFAGIRALTELGVINARKMPGWLTGEAGVSTGVVKDGRIQGWEGGL